VTLHRTYTRALTVENCLYQDELAPISCKGHDTHNCHGCLLTFYDALDTLVVLDNRTEFQRVVRWLADNGAAAFDRDQSVSVFEAHFLKSTLFIDFVQ
jgi:hypothetical protein